MLGNIQAILELAGLGFLSMIFCVYKIKKS